MCHRHLIAPKAIPIPRPQLCQSRPKVRCRSIPSLFGSEPREGSYSAIRTHRHSNGEHTTCRCHLVAPAVQRIRQLSNRPTQQGMDELRVRLCAAIRDKHKEQQSQDRVVTSTPEPSARSWRRRRTWAEQAVHAIPVASVMAHRLKKKSQGQTSASHFSFTATSIGRWPPYVCARRRDRSRRGRRPRRSARSSGGT